MEASEESRAYVQFLVPHALESQLAAFLAKLEAASLELGICDIQMSLTSLEEVFLNIARKVTMDNFSRDGELWRSYGTVACCVGNTDIVTESGFECTIDCI